METAGAETGSGAVGDLANAPVVARKRVAQVCFAVYPGEIAGAGTGTVYAVTSAAVCTIVWATEVNFATGGSLESTGACTGSVGVVAGCSIFTGIGAAEVDFTACVSFESTGTGAGAVGDATDAAVDAVVRATEIDSAA